MLRELPWKVNQGVFISPEIKFFATQVETSPQLEKVPTYPDTLFNG